MLPKEPVFTTAQHEPAPRNLLRVQGAFTLPRDMMLDGLQPEQVPAGQSLRIVAALPGGSIEPLLWLHEYDTRYAHPFLLRQPLLLPAGTRIQGVSPDATVALIPQAQ